MTDHVDLTPESIASWPLRKGVTGYRVDEVDALLDRVADRIDELQQQMARQVEELHELRVRADEAAATDATLKRTLVMAQRAAEETVASAREQATAMVDEAQQEAASLRTEATTEADEVRSAARRDADEFLADAQRARHEAELRVIRLRGIAEGFRTQLQEHLDAHRELLNNLPGAPPDLEPAVSLVDEGLPIPPSGEDEPEPEDAARAAADVGPDEAPGGAGLFGVRRGPWRSGDADEDDA